MLLVSAVILSVSLVFTNAQILDSELRDVKGGLLPNNISVTFERVDDEVSIYPTPTDLPNEGDIIADHGKEENDTLLFTEIFINKRNNTQDDVYVMKIKETGLTITEIRLLNVGRQIIAALSHDFVKKDDKTTAEVKFFVRKSQQVRVWVEVYGRSSSTILASSWVLMSLSALFYYVVNKQ